RRQPAGDGSADAARIRGLPRAGRHGHDHCFVFCASREPMSGSALVAAGQTAPGPGGPLALACGPHEAAGRPLYRIAPKNSPPV
ncbi:MAG TPA: hypothetical protein VEL05_10255, partial [Candidatus Acidoferrum sp.]|nr:hypothetical protein [Candidatus Acidoferrum sp.]